jgi:hypothetical protein
MTRHPNSNEEREHHDRIIMRCAITIQPTREQEECIDQFSAGNSLRINAYAGTRKTSTLVVLAKSTLRSGAYTACSRRGCRGKTLHLNAH